MARAELGDMVRQAVAAVRQELIEEWTDCGNAGVREALWLQQKNLNVIESKLMEAIGNGGK